MPAESKSLMFALIASSASSASTMTSMTTTSFAANYATGILSRPRNESVMMTGVVSIVKQTQVAFYIIERVAIQMMNMLRTGQFPAQKALHYNSMLIFPAWSTLFRFNHAINESLPRCVNTRASKRFCTGMLHASRRRTHSFQHCFAISWSVPTLRTLVCVIKGFTITATHALNWGTTNSAWLTDKLKRHDANYYTNRKEGSTNSC